MMNLFMYRNKPGYANYIMLMLCSLAVIFFASYAGAIEVTVLTGINHDPPYVYGDEEISVEFPGVTIDVLRLIEAKSDIKFNIEKHPWKRVVKEVRGNRVDGGFHFSFKEERRSFIAYPIPEGEILPDPKYSISNRSYVIYRLKGQSIHWNGSQIVLDSDDGNIIGAIRGGSITHDLKKPGFQLLEVNTDGQLLKLLLAKRVNAVIGLENMIDAKIKTLDPQAREFIEKSLPEVVNKPYYIAFSKKFYRENPEYAWKIWNTIDIIRKNGELQEIFARYINKGKK